MADKIKIQLVQTHIGVRLAGKVTTSVDRTRLGAHGSCELDFHPAGILIRHRDNNKVANTIVPFPNIQQIDVIIDESK